MRFNIRDSRIAIALLLAATMLYCGVAFGQTPAIRRVVFPSIQFGASKEIVLVSYDKGTIGACVVFQQQVKGEPDTNFPDGMYTPRICWYYEAPIDVATTEGTDWSLIERYNTPWKIWAEVFTESAPPVVGPDGQVHFSEPIMTRTNVIEVVR